VASHPMMEVGRTSPYRRHHLSSCSTNESSDGSSKSISLDLVEGSTVSDMTNHAINQKNHLFLSNSSSNNKQQIKRQA
jgi:hypothetical protein